MFGIGVPYGLREGELLDLKVKQIDLIARTIRLFKSKNAAGRLVELAQNAVEHCRTIGCSLGAVEPRTMTAVSASA
jgi:integrase